MDGEQRQQRVKQKHKRKRTKNKNKGQPGGNDTDHHPSGEREAGIDLGTGNKQEEDASACPVRKDAGMVVEHQGRSTNNEKRSNRKGRSDGTTAPPSRPTSGEAGDKLDANAGSGVNTIGGGKRAKKRRRRESAVILNAAASVGTAAPVPPLTEKQALHGGGGGGRSSSGAKKAKTNKAAAGNTGDNPHSNNSRSSSNNDGDDNGRSKGKGLTRRPSLPSAVSDGASSSGGGGTRARSGASTGAAAAAPRLSELQQRMRHKLEGAQFRMINETLYTSESGESLAKFKDEPELFDVYHRGFREQVEKWPVHPLDIIIGWLGKYPKARVADFGCGEARLAATVSNKVHSFDLVSPNPLVTACDMAQVPLKDASVHVAVFCLSLMGTNLADFLREAHRVLVPGGLVKVAEVRSRFEGEEGGVDRFLDVTRRLGFDCRQMDRSNKMFLMAEFKKSARKPERGVDFEAKACIYKRR